MRTGGTVIFVAGTIAILAFAALLAFEEPSPGTLALAHAGLQQLDRLPGCATCHTEGGLDAGCLGCHEEIAGQRREGRGLHAQVSGDCASCHPEHNGEGFDLMEGISWGRGGRGAFRHGHVEFTLAGAHEELACKECHSDRAFALPGFPDRKRESSYLGLSQQCKSCHEDVHRGEERTADCASCHGQAHFRPADRFDHAARFPLTGAHARAECTGCHTDAIAFDRVAGKACRDCHETPHRTDFGEECETCHRADDESWSAGRQAFTAMDHAGTGFALARPHDQVSCAKCHVEGGSYEERFARPGRAPQECRTCHEDPHAGQFGERACLACHEAERFLPSTYGAKEHAMFALVGAHAAVTCNACHTAPADGGARRFVGTPRECRSCHEDLHGGQFGSRGCESCHGNDRWMPTRYDLATHTAFALSGGHRAVACRSCHREEPEDGRRRFAGTTHSCKACHADPHGGQFQKELRKGDCTSCHRADAATFDIRPFDHAAKTGTALTGAHAAASCNDCHRTAGKVRTYRGTAELCSACHTDAHRGQFGAARCDTCHLSTQEWDAGKFDHARTRFPLDGTHRKVACAACHLDVKQPDGSHVTQYRPLGTQCGDCHDFKSR